MGNILHIHESYLLPLQGNLNCDLGTCRPVISRIGLGLEDCAQAHQDRAKDLQASIEDRRHARVHVPTLRVSISQPLGRADLRSGQCQTSQTAGGSSLQWVVAELLCRAPDTSHR